MRQSSDDAKEEAAAGPVADAPKLSLEERVAALEARMEALAPSLAVLVGET
jgi:hypothetical protein